MRNIKSVWTKPKDFFFDGLEELASLSILSTIKHTGACEVFADELGAEWIAALKLPIKPGAITRELRNTPGDGYAWNEGKLYCNAIQTSPYLQSDLDVVLGRDWPNRVKAGAIVAERAYNLEHSWTAGLPIIMPAQWAEAIERGDSRSFACGTYGGNDIIAIRRLAAIGLDFLERNRKAIQSVDAYICAAFAEEWSLVQGYDWMEVTTILPSGNDGHRFAALSKSYLHKIGKGKREEPSRKDVARRLAEYAPGQVKRCREVRNWIASFKDPN